MSNASTGVAFSAGSFVVYWFAVFLAAAMVTALVMTSVLAKKRLRSDDLAVDLCIVCIPCGVVGGRLFAVLCGQLSLSQFFRFQVWGLSLYGAAFVCLGGIAVYCAIKKRRLLDVLDLVTPGLFSAIAVGRWADCLHRTAYGPVVQQSYLKWFPIATYGPDNSIRFAPFFYTFLLCAVLVLLYFLLFYNKTRRRGMAFLSLTALYAVAEFFIEWLRQDRAMLLGLRFNQWMCLLTLLGCALAYLLYVRKLEPEPPMRPSEPEETDEADESLPSDEMQQEETVLPEEPQMEADGLPEEPTSTLPETEEGNSDGE